MFFTFVLRQVNMKLLTCCYYQEWFSVCVSNCSGCWSHLPGFPKVVCRGKLQFICWPGGYTCFISCKSQHLMAYFNLRPYYRWFLVSTFLLCQVEKEIRANCIKGENWHLCGRLNSQSLGSLLLNELSSVI